MNQLLKMEQDAADFHGDNMDPYDPSRPSQNDELRWLTAERHLDNRECDAELAALLSTTEIMIASFYKVSNSTQRIGQIFFGHGETSSFRREKVSL